MAGSGLDWDAVLAPVTADEPAGPDLSYDADRQVIEDAFARPADEVDWGDTVALIAAQAERTRDAWLPIYLARAGARAGDLNVVSDAALLLAEWFERFWDTLHPTLEEYGVEGRKGACESLVRIGEFLGPLRRVPLVEHPRLGSFTGADFERFAAEGAEATGYGQFRAAIADLPQERLDDVLATLKAIEDALTRADTVLSEQASLAGQTGTNFTPTFDVLEEIAAAVRPYASVDDVDVGVKSAGDVASGDAQPASTMASSPGRIGNRGDVARALDAVIDYYERNEPSSPIPVALGRIKGWIAMDFLAILNDVAPGAVGEASGVLRARTESVDSADMM